MRCARALPRAAHVGHELIERRRSLPGGERGPECVDRFARGHRRWMYHGVPRRDHWQSLQVALSLISQNPLPHTGRHCAFGIGRQQSFAHVALLSPASQKPLPHTARQAPFGPVSQQSFAHVALRLAGLAEAVAAHREARTVRLGRAAIVLARRVTLADLAKAVAAHRRGNNRRRRSRSNRSRMKRASRCRRRTRCRTPRRTRHSAPARNNRSRTMRASHRLRRSRCRRSCSRADRSMTVRAVGRRLPRPPRYSRRNTETEPQTKLPAGA